MTIDVSGLQNQVTNYYRPIAIEKIIGLIEYMKQYAIDNPDADNWGVDQAYMAMDVTSNLNMAVFGIDMHQFSRSMNPSDMIKALFEWTQNTNSI